MLNQRRHCEKLQWSLSSVEAYPCKLGFAYRCWRNLCAIWTTGVQKSWEGSSTKHFPGEMSFHFCVKYPSSVTPPKLANICGINISLPRPPPNFSSACTQLQVCCSLLCKKNLHRNCHLHMLFPPLKTCTSDILTPSIHLSSILILLLSRER